jgi:hypothetical protein
MALTLSKAGGQLTRRRLAGSLEDRLERCSGSLISSSRRSPSRNPTCQSQSAPCAPRSSHSSSLQSILHLTILLLYPQCIPRPTLSLDKRNTNREKPALRKFMWFLSLDLGPNIRWRRRRPRPKRALARFLLFQRPFLLLAGVEHVPWSLIRFLRPVLSTLHPQSSIGQRFSNDDSTICQAR